MSEMTRVNPCCWSTSTFGGMATASPMEFSALQEHLALCRESERRLFALQCAAERMRGFFAARFITTLMLMALITAFGSLAL